MESLLNLFKMDKMSTYLFHTMFKFMNTSLGFGEKWNQLRLLPTFEHELFFYFLLMSSSYALAHQLKGKKIPSGMDVPADFDKVRKAYDLVGNIYEATFEDWWQGGGYQLFDYQSEVKKLTISVDLTKPQATSLSEITATIKNAYAQNKKKSTGQKIAFIKNKLHYSAINDRKNFLMAKAIANYKLGRDVENWRVAVKARILSKWIEGLTVDVKPTQDNLKARVALGELSHKLARDGWHLSENAARLEFPSVKPNPNAIPIEYPVLALKLFKYGQIEVAMLERYKDNPELLIRDQYLLNIKREFRKKRKLEKTIEKAVDKAVDKALEEEKENQAKLALLHSSSSRR